MNEENEPVLMEIEEDFAEGRFVEWKDGETKTVVIANWGVYEKETKFGKRYAFRADVVNINGKEYILKQKLIDTTSLHFQKAVKPFIINAKLQDKLTLVLKISRKGEKEKSTYFVEEVKIPIKEEQAKLKVSK